MVSELVGGPHDLGVVETVGSGNGMRVSDIFSSAMVELLLS